MQNKNIIYRITYILFIIFFLLGAVFYRQSFLAVLLILTCLLPIISIGITALCFQKISINVTPQNRQITRGHPAILSITGNNPCFFSFFNCEIHFTAKNLFYKNDISHTVSIPLPARRENTAHLDFPTSRAGLTEFAFAGYTLTDPLHLYTFTQNIKKTINIPVLPEENKKEYPLFPAYSPEDDSDELTSLPGALSHDIKDLHEYRPGNSLKDIHWKVTARTEVLTVKEYDSSASRILVLLPDLYARDIDMTLTTLYSYMFYLAERKEIFKLFLYNCRTGEISTQLVTDKSEVEEAFLKTYFLPLCPTSNLEAEAVKFFLQEESYIKIYRDTITQC